MSATAIAIAVAIAIVVYVGYKAIQDATARNSRRGDWAIFIVRWLTGSHWTGRPQTNAGWKRHGTKALTQTGFAPRFYFRPRWERLCFRLGWTFGPLAALYGLWRATLITELCLIVTTASVVSWQSWRLARRTIKRWHRREWLQPIHESIAPRVGVPLSARPGSWIEVDTNPSRAIQRAVFHLPAGFSESETQRKTLAEVAARRLGMESPEVNWEISGREPRLELEASTMPSDIVRFNDVAGYMNSAAEDEIILGQGKHRQPVDVSLHEDSPHIGASMGSGAGKSTLARLVAAQALHKGAIVVILDIKKTSHPWARGLPNVAYCDTPELIHQGLLWLGSELDRRNDLAVFTSDEEGNMSATAGARILIIAEELNMTANRLRTYWRDVLGGQGPSPALLALQDVAFAGRQVMMNIFFVGQMLTARVTGGTSGGNEARENIGVRMLARFTKRNWDMLVPEFPMPVNSDTLGRIQVVASGQVRECQVAMITGVQARDYATNGKLALLPADIPGSKVVPVRGFNQKAIEKPFSPAVQANSPEPLTDEVVIPVQPITISDAIDQGILRGNINTVRSWRRLDPDFPKPVDRPPDGNSLAHYYDPVELADYQAARRDKRGKK